MNKLLIVYNICGIKRNTPQQLNQYNIALDSILDQDFNVSDRKIIVKACLSSEQILNKLLNKYQNDISFNTVHEPLTVNVTFNQSCMLGMKEWGNFEGYIYVDSGMLFNRPDVLSIMYNTFKSGPFGIVTALAENDNATEEHFGWSYPPNKQDFIVPVGKSTNCHVCLFCHKLYETYGELMQGTPKNHCTESLFSFLCAAINKKMVICGDLKLPHVPCMDGASAGFEASIINYKPWAETFRSRRPMEEIVRDPLGLEVGCGFEECGGVMMHDQSKFDENGYAKDPRLKTFIKDNFCLGPDIFDYGAINHTWIPVN